METLRVSTQKFLTNIELWPTLMKLAKTCKSRAMIAVPYLGTGGSNLLPLKKGDVVICALSEANARNGSVNPFEIKKFQNDKIKVYQQSELHAKVYLFGRTAIIASANLSRRSLSHLDEVGLLTRDPNIIRSIKSWFTERFSEPITPEWLAYCTKIYRPPQNESRGKHSGDRKPSSNLWFIGVSDMPEFPEYENKARDTGYNVARKHLRKPSLYEIDEIRWTGKSNFLDKIKRGDLLTQVWDRGKTDRRVCPHARLLGKKRTKTKTGASVTYLYLEIPKNYRTLAWKQFRQACEEQGLVLSPNLIAREIRNQSMVRKLKAMVSPERLMMKKRGRS